MCPLFHLCLFQWEDHIAKMETFQRHATFPQRQSAAEQYHLEGMAHAVYVISLSLSYQDSPKIWPDLKEFCLSSTGKF